MSRTKWSKELIINNIKSLYERGVSLNIYNMQKIDGNLLSVGKKHFGNWENAINASGLDYNKIRRKLPDGYWNEEHVIKALKERKERQLHMSASYIINDDGSLYNACLRSFGSYQNAIEACGWNYDDIREDSEKLYYYGFLFQELLGKIFIEMNMSYTKGFSNEIRPDFVFKKGTWIDAKLSEWTIHSCDTIQKYEPFCNELFIVYLRGDKERVEILTEKTKILSVYKLIEHLPSDKNKYYKSKLNDLWRRADEQEEKEIENISHDGKSEYRGLSWSKKGKKWVVMISVNWEQIYLGSYKNETDAAKVYDKYVLDNNLPYPLNFGENPIMKKLNKSKYTGVSWDKKTNSWRVYTTVNKKQIHIGRYESEMEAAKAYNDYITKYDLNRPLNKIS